MSYRVFKVHSSRFSVFYCIPLVLQKCVSYRVTFKKWPICLKRASCSHLKAHVHVTRVKKDSCVWTKSRKETYIHAKETNVCRESVAVAFESTRAHHTCQKRYICMNKTWKRDIEKRHRKIRRKDTFKTNCRQETYMHLESSKQNYYIISLRAIIKAIFTSHTHAHSHTHIFTVSTWCRNETHTRGERDIEKRHRKEIWKRDIEKKHEKET